jgi:hypothetical protein
VPRRGIGEDRLIGLEDAFQPGEAFIGDGAKLRPGKIHRAAVHRPQDAVGDVGRPRIHEEMPAVRHLSCL